MSRLAEFLNDVNTKGDEEKAKLLAIIRVMDETLTLFNGHTKKCNMKIHDFPKNKVMGCDCGASSVEDTFEEIEDLLEDDYPTQ